MTTATKKKTPNSFAKDYANFMIEIQQSSIARSEAYNYDYLTLDAIVKTATPIAVKNNLIFYWSTEHIDEKDPIVHCFLRHTTDEEFISTSIPAHYARTGKVMQSAGGALTYARRYGLQQVLCISPDKDDDAKDVMIAPTGKISNDNGNRASDAQLGLLRKLVSKDTARLLEMKNDGVEFQKITGVQASAYIAKWKDWK